MKRRFSILFIPCLIILALLTACDADPATNLSVSRLYVTGFESNGSATAYALAGHEYKQSEITVYGISSKNAFTDITEDTDISVDEGTTLGEDTISFEEGEHTLTATYNGLEATLTVNAIKAYELITFSANGQLMENTLLSTAVFLKTFSYFNENGEYCIYSIPQNAYLRFLDENDEKIKEDIYASYLSTAEVTPDDYSGATKIVYYNDDSVEGKEVTINTYYPTADDTFFRIGQFSGNQVTIPKVGNTWDDYFPDGLSAFFFDKETGTQVGMFTVGTDLYSRTIWTLEDGEYSEVDYTDEIEAGTYYIRMTYTIEGTESIPTTTITSTNYVSVRVS